MEKENIYMLMVQNMKENGKMINKMVMVLKYGLMDQNIKVLNYILRLI